MSRAFPLVIIESPYTARRREALIDNRNYLKACILDSISRGEAPFAGHGFYTSFLNDRDLNARALGMRLSVEFLIQADLVCVYLDRGWSSGMRQGVATARRYGKPIEERWINWVPSNG